jgi:hypothetical protein
LEIQCPVSTTAHHSNATRPPWQLFFRPVELDLGKLGSDEEPCNESRSRQVSTQGCGFFYVTVV